LSGAACHSNIKEQTIFPAKEPAGLLWQSLLPEQRQERALRHYHGYVWELQRDVLGLTK
jgi:hypothetical protein